MDEKKRAAVHAWLLKAQRDLAVAHKLSGDDDPYLDSAIYHCQQAAEKAIKAYLVFQDQRFEKTHDLELLTGLAQPYEAGFSSLLKPAVLLTPYASEFRYPGDFIDPSREEFEEAMEATKKVWKFVLSLVPFEAHP
jgi:HEPN domain-containing protein